MSGQIPNGNFDSSSIINMMMGGYTMSMMSQLKDSSFSYQTVLIFIFLIMMNDIKTYIKDSLEYIKNNFSKFLYCVWENLSKIKYSCKRKNIISFDIEDHRTYIDVEVETNIFTIDLLHNYLSTIKTEYTNNFSIISESFDKQIMSVNYNSIIFEIDQDTRAICNNNIQVNFNKSDNNVVSYNTIRLNVQNDEKHINRKDIENYYFVKECMIPEIKEYIIKRLESFSFKQINSITQEFLELCNIIAEGNYPNECINNKIFIGAKNCEFVNYLILVYLLSINPTDIIKNKISFIINYLVLLLISDYRYSNDKMNRVYISYTSNYLRVSTNNSGTIYNLTLKRPQNYVNPKLNWMEEFSTSFINKNVESYMNSIQENKLNSSSLSFEVISNMKIDKKLLYDKFFDYYKKIILTPKSKNTEVSVYSIGIIKKEEVKDFPNPEYDEWQELFNEGKKSSDEMKESNNKSITIELLKIKPSKTIRQTIISMIVDCKEINKFQKNLSTLYLREIDKLKLLNVVDKFKNKKHVYEQLGIPHKLCMMFHGAPGTGKTTSIKAIATYLSKDLYFVNLKNIRTNSELKSIFDHINDKCNGGVIVFEDIDVMTDVVKKRSIITEINLTDAFEEGNDKLTLSYLLNLLDGSLCKDGTIFAITTNYIENIDPALYRKGRVDITIDFKKCDHYQLNQIYESIIGRKIKEEILYRIPENKYAPCDIIFHVYQYMLEDLPDEVIMKDFLI
jgi:AAA+ superfamily predicted ATPase